MENCITELMSNLTLEECFIKYHTQHIACICNADKKEVIFCKE